MSQIDIPQKNSAEFRLAKRLFLIPILYPLIRVQTYMQSH